MIACGFEQADEAGEHAADGAAAVVDDAVRAPGRRRRSARSSAPRVRPGPCVGRSSSSSASVEATVSRQPRFPHRQTAPFSTTYTWPSSPANPVAPRWSRPPRIEPAADARRDHDVDHVGEPAGGAERDLRQRAEVRVVVDRDRQVEPPRQLGARIQARPVGEDHRVADASRSGRPGRRCPCRRRSRRERSMPGLAQHDVHQRDRGVERGGLRVVDVELELALGEHGRGEIGGGHADVVVAEVDAERGARGRVEAQQRRRPAAARGLEVRRRRSAPRRGRGAGGR